MDFDADDIIENDEKKPPTSIVIVTTAPAIFDQSSSSSSSSSLPEDQEEEVDNSRSSSTLSDEQEEEVDNSISSSSSSSSSSQSLPLNPNSSIDNLDLPGIALLKEIFPHETTESLRELHYQHILLNKTPSSVSSPVSSSTLPTVEAAAKTITMTSIDKDENDIDIDHTCQERLQLSRQQISETRQQYIPTIDLPHDFLRLPKSVAILRQQRQSSNKNKDGDNLQDGRTYEFIHELETRALEEYHLAASRDNEGNNNNNSINSQKEYLSDASQTQGPLRQGQNNNVEYYTYVVDKDDRWGLGMTLQEVIEEGEHLRHQQRQFKTTRTSGSGSAHHAIIRYGLMVIGFLPDPKKIQGGEIVSRISQSPAETSGIRCSDVVIGINGTAFLLQVPLTSTSYNVDRQSDEYRIQKEKIVRSIQKSPTPVVVHIRRMKSGPTTKNERSANSLLDTVTFDLEEGEIESMFIQPKDSVTYGQRQQQQQQHFSRQSPIPPLQSSSSSAFFKASPAQTPSSRSKSSCSVRHPLSIAMVERNLIRSGEDQWRITRRLQQFTERSRQWESSNSLRIVISNGKFRGVSGSSNSLGLAPHFDPNDLPPDMADLMVFAKQKTTETQQYDSVTIENEDKNSVVSQITNDDYIQGYQEVGKSSFLSRDQHTEQSQLQQRSHSGAQCTPSTPTLPFDSPLIPMEYLQAFYGSEKAEEIRSNASYPSSGYESTSRRLFRPQQVLEGLNKDRSVTNKIQTGEDMAWIPLYGIRKSLSARIVNSFVEESGRSNIDKTTNNVSRIAYTMWVYDVESGREWYAPIRYWQDFSDLHRAALNLLPPTSNLYKELTNVKFPKEPAIPNNSNDGWAVSVFGNRHSSSLASPMSPLQQRRRQKKNDEFEDARQQTCRLLEELLMELLGIMYTCEPLHPNMAEIALYVQSFLGVDAGLEDGTVSFSDKREFKSMSERIEDETRQLLKRSIQRYSWRVFLLHTMKAIVRDFVDSARARGPKLQDIECMEAGKKLSLKARAMDELAQIRSFLDQLVDLILDGCNEDLLSIAKRREFSPIRKYLVDESYWDRLVREGVREQVEIEVYVSLRSVVSRLLVNGWRHEDMEVLFKIKVNTLL
jgi:hypothetical protein